MITPLNNAVFVLQVSLNSIISVNVTLRQSSVGVLNLSFAKIGKNVTVNILM